MGTLTTWELQSWKNFKFRVFVVRDRSFVARKKNQKWSIFKTISREASDNNLKLTIIWKFWLLSLSKTVIIFCKISFKIAYCDEIFLMVIFGFFLVTEYLGKIFFKLTNCIWRGQSFFWVVKNNKLIYIFFY